MNKRRRRKNGRTHPLALLAQLGHLQCDDGPSLLQLGHLAREAVGALLSLLRGEIEGGEGARQAGLESGRNLEGARGVGGTRGRYVGRGDLQEIEQYIHIWRYIDRFMVIFIACAFEWA